MSTASSAAQRGVRRGMARQMLGAPRGRVALATNGISSLGNLALAIAVARSSSLAGLGEFAIAFAVYVLATGAARAAITNSVLMSNPGRSAIAQATGRTLLFGLVAGVPVAAIGVVTGTAYLIVLGAALPGIVVYDYIKTTHMGVGSARRACCQELSWTLLSMLAVVPCLLGYYGGQVAFGGWAGSCAAIGLGHAAVLHYRLVPTWDASRAETMIALTFGCEYLFGAGMAQVTLIVLAGVAGIPVVGALRGAGTALGPITLIAGTAPTLLIPYVRRLRDGAELSRAQSARVVTAVLLVVATPLLVAVSVLPDRIGQVLLGGNWTASRALIPVLAAELFFQLAAAVPLAGHRVELAGVKTLVLRAGLSSTRVPLVLVCGHYFGAPGAAWAMAGSSLVAAMTWWASYSRLTRP